MAKYSDRPFYPASNLLHGSLKFTEGGELQEAFESASQLYRSLSPISSIEDFSLPKFEEKFEVCVNKLTSIDNKNFSLMELTTYKNTKKCLKFAVRQALSYAEGLSDEERNRWEQVIENLKII